MTLRRFMYQDGAMKKGALACVARHLGVNASTVRRWLTGEYKPGVDRARQIRAMIAQNIPISTNYNRCGRKTK